MDKLKNTLAASAIATMAAGSVNAQELFPYIDAGDVNGKVSIILSEGCPDLTPGDFESAKICVEAVARSMHEISVGLNNFIAMNPGLPNGIFAQGELLKCDFVQGAFHSASAKLQTPADQKAYLDQGLSTAISCLDNIDTAENGIELWVNQDAQNKTVSQINRLMGAQCFVKPEFGI